MKVLEISFQVLLTPPLLDQTDMGILSRSSQQISTPQTQY